ncbi:MAG: flagellar protein FlgN [Gammaproteobacteria bacterium]|nr:flagellar protein FlgN [Gammaproteobacteria bacterium]
MDRAQAAKAFAATVQASLHGLRQLEPLLGREREALGGRDPDALTRVVDDKLALLRALEPSVKARDRLLAALGLPQGVDGGARLVAAIDDPELARDWSTLVELAAAVADISDSNAQLVAQGQRETRAALGILTGRDASDDTYSNLRRKGGDLPRQVLGKV